MHFILHAYNPKQKTKMFCRIKVRHINGRYLRNNWSLYSICPQRKAIEIESDPEKKSSMIHALRHCEATQDFHTGSIKQINPLIQFDAEPNLEFNETRVELYKISISFEAGGKITICYQFVIFNISVFKTFVPRYIGRDRIHARF